MYLCLPNLEFIALPVPEIIGGTEKIWAVPGYAHAPFFANVSWACVRMDPVNVSATFEVCSFPVPETVIAVLGWGCKPQILGKGRR